MAWVNESYMYDERYDRGYKQESEEEGMRVADIGDLC